MSLVYNYKRLHTLSHHLENSLEFKHHLESLTTSVTFSHTTAQNIKFSIMDFFSKWEQIRSFLRICSHFL